LDKVNYRGTIVNTQWAKGLQKIVRWFLDADDNPDSHQKPNYYFLAHLQCSLKFACKFLDEFVGISVEFKKQKVCENN